MRGLDAGLAKQILHELRVLPALEVTAPPTPLADIDHGYQAIELPGTGYTAVYRWLEPDEIPQNGTNEDAVLVADLQPSAAAD
jgi:hypothetical protein